MGDRSKFDGDDRRDPQPRSDVRQDGTKRPRTHLGFPTPPPTPGSEVAFPRDEITRRTPIPAQLVDALKPSKPPVRETTRPFAADMPVPPPDTGQTLPPKAVDARPQNVRRTALGGHGSPEQLGAPAASQARRPDSPPTASPQSRPVPSPGPSLRLDPSDFGTAATQPTPPGSAAGESGPRLNLDETTTHSLEYPGAPRAPAGPQLQLGADDHLEGRSGRRSGGKGLLMLVIMVALAGGATFAFQRGSGPNSDASGASSPGSTAPEQAEASATTPAETSTEVAAGSADAPAGQQEPTRGASAEDARKAEQTGGAEKARETAAAKRAQQDRVAEARKAAAQRHKAAARRAAAKKTRKAAPRNDQDSPMAAPTDPEASSSLEEARRALQLLNSGGDQVLEVRPTADAPSGPESSQDYDELPPPPPPPPSDLSADDGPDEPY